LDVEKRFSEEQIIGFVRETENVRLKRRLADATLENEITKEALRKEW
jgi:hypothetical protein